MTVRVGAMRQKVDLMTKTISGSDGIGGSTVVSTVLESNIWAKVKNMGSKLQTITGGSANSTFYEIIMRYTLNNDSEFEYSYSVFWKNVNLAVHSIEPMEEAGYTKIIAYRKNG